MRAISAALSTVLTAGGPFVLADLYTITLSNGTVFHWTNIQNDITVGGITYVLGPPIEREKVSWKLGLSVDSLPVNIEDDGTATVNGRALVVAAWQGMFDLAQVTVDRFISDSWSNTAVGSVNVFTGEIGDIKIESKKITLTVESATATLKSTMPRTYILPSCVNTLYDGICGLLEANFTSAGTVGGTPTATSFTLAGITQADDYYQLGTIKFTSGMNNGQVRGVKSYLSGVITLIYPLYSIPAVGDTVNAIAGCDKTRTVCLNRFNNMPHFRGFPYVPDPSTQYTGAGGGTGDGGGTGGGGGSGNRQQDRGSRGRHGNLKQF